MESITGRGVKAVIDGDAVDIGKLVPFGELGSEGSTVLVVVNALRLLAYDMEPRK